MTADKCRMFTAIRKLDVTRDEDAALLAAALRVAAEHYDRVAASSATPRTRRQFKQQAARCRAIATTIKQAMTPP